MSEDVEIIVPDKPTDEYRRNSRGLFGKGNPGGPGRPKGTANLNFGQTLLRLHKAGILDLEEDVRKIYEAMLLRIEMRLCPVAAKLLLGYIMGPLPTTAVQINTGDGSIQGDTSGPPVPKIGDMLAGIKKLSALQERFADSLSGAADDADDVEDLFS